MLEQALGFGAVLLGAGNAAGGFAVTQRMLAMFQPSTAALKLIPVEAKSQHAKKA